MQERSILERVAILEQKVELLESLPERVSGVELQILQLRTDMNAGIYALRSEVGALGETLRAEIRSGDEETRRFMRMLYEDVIARIAAGKG